MNSNKYYTPDGQHPEDAIYHAKRFINELTNVQESYFQKLVKDLKLDEQGEDWLFDYIHNSGEEGEKLTFEEYLDGYNQSYEKLVTKDAYYVPFNEIVETESDFQYSDEVESVFPEDDLSK